MSLTINIVLCGLLIVATICVGLYRKWLEDHCDHYIHLHNDTHDAAVVNSQQDLCRRMELMGKLQTILIALSIAYAVAIVAIISYNAWKTAGAAS